MRKMLAVCMAIILVGVLIGCGAKSNESSQPSPSGSGGAAASGEPSASGQGNASDEKVELSMWIFLNPELTDDPRSVALKSIVDSFNATHPNTQVKVNSIHYEKIDAQVIQATAAGAGPDILNVYTDMLSKHLGARTIQPITDYARAWLDKDGGNYIYTEDQLKVNGEVYAMPWEARVFTMFYNKEAYDSAGLAAPETLSELIEAAAKLSDRNRLGYAVGLSESGNAAAFIETFEPILRAAGGQLFDADGKAAFNNEAGLKAVQFFKDMLNAGGMNNQTISMNADDITNGLKAGNIATAVSGSMRAASIRSSEVGKNIETTPIPPFEKGDPLPVKVAGQTLTIGANTKHADRAWEFIEYFLNEESQEKWAKASVMPVLSSVYDLPAIKELSNYEEILRWKNNANAYGKIEFYPEDFTVLCEQLAKAVQLIVFQDEPAQELLDKVAEAYNKDK